MFWYVLSHYLLGSVFFHSLTCLCQADLGAVSVRGPTWEREGKASHPGGVDRMEGVRVPVVHLGFLSFRPIQGRMLSLKFSASGGGVSGGGSDGEEGK